MAWLCLIYSEYFTRLLITSLNFIYSVANVRYRYYSYINIIAYLCLIYYIFIKFYNTSFEEYSENVVNSKKKEIINEEVQNIKKELMGKTDIENNCIKTKDFFELKEKYEKELEKVEDKLENLKGNKEKVVNKEEVQEKVKEEKELEIE